MAEGGQGTITLLVRYVQDGVRDFDERHGVSKSVVEDVVAGDAFDG